MKLSSIAIVATLVSTLPRLIAAEPATKPIKPCVVITGADSRLSKARYCRITSTDEWARLWQEHKGEKTDRTYDFFYDLLTLPQVDFDAYMVVAIFQGEGWNAAAVNAVSIFEEVTRILFRFENRRYQTWENPEKVKAYSFFVLPRSTKPVVLEENARLYPGQPPVWKERASFPGR